VSLNSQRVAISEQKPNERTKNFNEVILGYSKKEALVEASRCLNCKNAPCIKDCPVNINISGFIKEVAKNNIKKAYSIITENNSLPGVCGRVCPQELQCQKNCTLGIKGDSIAIGNLERYVADNVV